MISKIITRPGICILILLLPVFYGSSAVGWGILALYGAVTAALAVSVKTRRLAILAGIAVCAGISFEIATFFYASDSGSLEGGAASGSAVVSLESSVRDSGFSTFEIVTTRIRKNGIDRDLRVRIQVQNFPGSSPHLGEVWEWSGVLSSLDGPPGTPHYSLRWKSGRALGWENPSVEIRSSILSRLKQWFDRMPPGPSALSQALLWGRTDELTADEKAAFRDSGSSHVLALSGMHLGFLALVLSGALGWWTSRFSRFVVLQLVLVLFCLLAGPIASLWRAWVGTLIVGWAQLRWKTVRFEDVLAASFIACCLLWPYMTSTLSLELSFLSLWGIVRWGRTLELTLRPWIGRMLASSVGTSVAATLSTFALTSWVFRKVALVGIVVSFPLVLITTIHLVFSIAFVAVSLTGSTALDGLFSGLLSVGYQACFAVARWGARFPAVSAQIAWILAGGWGLFSFWVLLYKNRHRSSNMGVRLNYDSRADLQAFLDSRGLNALKRWGQNFLVNKGAREQILAALELQPNESVWEIGPGLGALTHHLVEAGHPLKVFEIDPGYVQFLQQEWGGIPSGFEVVEGDFIKTWRHHRGETGYKIVGNLPYNASSAIIADLIEGNFFPPIFVVTVQKEMAERMGAKVGSKNFSSFSVLCQSVFDVKSVVVLKPGSFYPVPEVTSWVVKLTPHRRYEGLDYRDFSFLVRECFAHRRKTLRNNVVSAAAALKVSLDVVEAAFDKNGIDLSLRAETLSVDQFVNVYKAIRQPKV